MVYKYRKPYRIKRRKPILRSPVLKLTILVLGVIIGMSYFLFFSGFFQVKKIIITGDKIISEDDVPRQNIFLIDVPVIEKDILDRFPQIASIEVRKSFPDTLNILITKRLPQALWCENEKCFYIDNNAVVFGEPVDAMNNLVKVIGEKELLSEEKMSQILKIKKELKDGSLATTTQALIVSDERLNIKTSEGWEIYFNLKGDLGWQMQELKLVLEKQITPEKRKNLEYVDLRFSRVYYK